MSIILKGPEHFGIYSFSTELDNCNRPINLQLTTNCFLFLTNDIILWSAKKKIHNCRVKFSCHDYFPYSGLYLEKEKESIEIDIIKFNSTRIFGKFQNGSYNELLGMLQNNHVEGVIGGFSLEVTQAKIFDHLYPYMMDNTKVVVPLASPLLTWVAVLTSVICQWLPNNNSLYYIFLCSFISYI